MQRSWRTAPRRCRRSGRGSPAGAQAAPATVPSRRRWPGPASGSLVPRSAGAPPAGRTRRKRAAAAPRPSPAWAATWRRTRPPGQPPGRGGLRRCRLEYAQMWPSASARAAARSAPSSSAIAFPVDAATRTNSRYPSVSDATLRGRPGRRACLTSRYWRASCLASSVWSAARHGGGVQVLHAGFGVNVMGGGRR